eukprot:CAMPEP_0204368268 /NCGR_PEP_ID=MMETSP0469-20131031/44056_1 /ASSEMBLY_ACC=CAM_ASM_000384 /TAXON_ID=2969 /ORGANISM="Oxyrrhis marina" /LENGTH=348 /DNA_ID=CAMNT_0051357805 /DNA_START=53 /DNA_END=1099 /DNA_ORIENTATION=-
MPEEEGKLKPMQGKGEITYKVVETTPTDRAFGVVSTVDAWPVPWYSKMRMRNIVGAFAAAGVPVVGDRAAPYVPVEGVVYAALVELTMHEGSPQDLRARLDKGDALEPLIFERKEPDKFQFLRRKLLHHYSRKSKLLGRETRLPSVPYAMLKGDAPFMGVRLQVAPGVFLPQGSSANVVRSAVAALKETLCKVVVDLGTGTGALAAGVLNAYPRALVIGVESDPVAVRCAQDNLAQFGSTAQVIHRDWNDLSGHRMIPTRVGVVICNPGLDKEDGLQPWLEIQQVLLSLPVAHRYVLQCAPSMRQAVESAYADNFEVDHVISGNLGSPVGICFALVGSRSCRVSEVEK